MKISNSLKKTGSAASALSLLIYLTPMVYAAGTKADAINKSLQKNPIVRDMQDIVNFLSAGVGIVVVAMIMMGGIQYSLAGDNPQKVTDAKKRITNALIALLAFLFIFAFVQWLIPGGILS